jgi:hypothetical protein
MREPFETFREWKRTEKQKYNYRQKIVKKMEKELDAFPPFRIELEVKLLEYKEKLTRTIFYSKSLQDQLVTIPDKFQRFMAVNALEPSKKQRKVIFHKKGKIDATHYNFFRTGHQR